MDWQKQFFKNNIILIIIVIGIAVFVTNNDDNRGLGESCGNTGDCTGSLVCQNRSSDQKLIFTLNAKSKLLIITHGKTNRTKINSRETNSR